MLELVPAQDAPIDRSADLNDTHTARVSCMAGAFLMAEKGPAAAIAIKKPIFRTFNLGGALGPICQSV